MKDELQYMGISYLRKVFHLSNAKSHELPQLSHQEMLLNYVHSSAWLHAVPDSFPILRQLGICKCC